MEESPGVVEVVDPPAVVAVVSAPPDGVSEEHPAKPAKATTSSSEKTHNSGGRAVPAGRDLFTMTSS